MAVRPVPTRDPELKTRTHPRDATPYVSGVVFNMTNLPGDVVGKGSFMRLGKQTRPAANRAGTAFIGNATPRSAPPLPDDAAFWRVYSGNTSRS